MALYEFQCPLHGIFDVRQPMDVEHEATCPECGKPAQRKFNSVPYWLDNPPDLSDIEKDRKDRARERATLSARRRHG